jgi:hypothetical protein
MSAYVDADGMRRLVPVEWCELCGMCMPADHETFRHADNPHLYPVRTNGPAGISDEAAHQPANDPRPKESPAMTILSEAAHRARVIDGLRLLASYLSDHPDVPVGFTPVSLEFSASASRSDEDGRAEVDRVAAMLGAATETSSHGTYSASKCFGAATYRVYAAPKAETSRINAGLSYLDSVTPDGGAS